MIPLFSNLYFRDTETRYCVSSIQKWYIYIHICISVRYKRSSGESFLPRIGSLLCQMRDTIRPVHLWRWAMGVWLGHSAQYLVRCCPETLWCRIRKWDRTQEAFRSLLTFSLLSVRGDTFSCFLHTKICVLGYSSTLSNSECKWQNPGSDYSLCWWRTCTNVAIDIQYIVLLANVPLSMTFGWGNQLSVCFDTGWHFSVHTYKSNYATQYHIRVKTWDLYSVILSCLCYHRTILYVLNLYYTTKRYNLHQNKPRRPSEPLMQAHPLGSLGFASDSASGLSKCQGPILLTCLAMPALSLDTNP